MPCRGAADWLQLSEIHECKFRYGVDVNRGAGRKYCYTAFAGIALEYTVVYAVVAFCLAELKGGVTILRAGTSVVLRSGYYCGTESLVGGDNI
jgi:hypothetical protein